MNRQKKDIDINANNYSEIDSWNDNDHTLSPENKNLWTNIGRRMRGSMDLEEVRNDPSLSSTDQVVKNMITDYNRNKKSRTENERFIRESLALSDEERNIEEEINEIKLEIDRKNIDSLSAEWVREWHERRQMSSATETETDERRDFITYSLKEDKEEYIKASHHVSERRKPSISRVVRYISLSAAAAFACLFLIKTLLLSPDPDRLFSSYYTPFDAVLPTTRGDVSGTPNQYTMALTMYNSGDFQSAAAGFTTAMLNDSDAIGPRFFMGITHIAMGNYAEAVSFLEKIAGGTGEYRKEALWYLGLAYLKTDCMGEAAECFTLLSQSPGFYSERAEKISRRLK